MRRVSVLDEIMRRRRAEVAALATSRPRPLDGAALAPTRSLAQAVRRSDRAVRVIAEHKRASPSEGDYGCAADVEAVVGGYALAGAVALSVLTEPRAFGGSDDHLRRARATVDLPILRKDFTVDVYQVEEARAIGADAILLIAAGLTLDDARRLADRAHELELEVLLELHAASELDYLDVEPDVVGVNNRNLATLAIDLATSRRLVTQLPTDRPRVTESGLATAEDAAALLAHGYDGMLVGTAFMKHPDPGAACGAFIADTAASLAGARPNAS